MTGYMILRHLPRPRNLWCCNACLRFAVRGAFTGSLREIATIMQRGLSMAKTLAAVTLNNDRFILMHRSVGKKFSIQIDLIGGSPPDSVPGLSVAMSKFIGGG